jgi:hypothetical protein
LVGRATRYCYGSASLSGTSDAAALRVRWRGMGSSCGQLWPSLIVASRE